MHSHRSGVLKIQNSSTCVRWNLLVIKEMQSLVVLLQTGYTVFKRSLQCKKECFMWRPYMSFCL